MNRPLWRKRAETIFVLSPPMSLFGPLLGQKHATRWHGRMWAPSRSDARDYDRIKAKKR